MMLSRSSNLRSVLLRRISLQSAAAAATPATSISSKKNSRYVVSSNKGLSTLSAGAALKKMATDSPHMEIIRYEHKNVKWTFKHVEFFADALANGFVDVGLRPGDVVLSWLPLHFSEHHILQFACSKAGFILYHLDPAQATTDPEGAKASLKRALEVTEANVLVQQEAGSDVNYIHLTHGVIPEIRIFDFAGGMPFFTPRFPHLRFPIHTGLSIIEKEGMQTIRDLLCPAGTLDPILKDAGCAPIDGKTPLMGELLTGPDGLPVKGKLLTNDQVLEANAWPEFTSILKKKYSEVEGVGVIF